MNWIQRLLTAITTHKAVAAAHHAKTVLFTSLTDRWTLAQAHRGALNKIMVFQGAGADPIEEDKPAGFTSSGTYTGNSTPNRAIAHGLGVTPKSVFLSRKAANSPLNRISDQDPDEIFWYHPDNTGIIAVATAMDATDFYVGNAISYDQSANLTGGTYYWIAIG